MQSTFIEHIDSPIDSTHYTDIRQLETPILLLGVQMKSKYDHDRLEICDRANPVRINCNERYFYGVQLQPNTYFTSIVNKIVTTPLNQTNSVHMYKERLKLYGLSCDTCWLHLQNNIFPLDAENLETVSINTRYMMNDNRLILTNCKDKPWFVQYANLKMYILT